MRPFLAEALPWAVATDSLPLRSGGNWPAYKPRAAPSAKSRQLWIAPATIAREVQRNGSSRQRGYQVAYAHQQARARRWRGSKLERDAALREQVLVRLKAGWSPEQVAGRLAQEAGRTVVAHETIYRFI